VSEIDANKDGKISPQELNPSKYKHNGGWRAIDLNGDGVLDARDWMFYRARRGARNVTLAVNPGDARGDLTDTHVVWRNERFVPQVSSPLVYGGSVWIVKDGGILTNLDAKTGKILKSARIPGAMDAYYSSPVAGDGKIYVASEAGKLAVIKPGADWEVLTVNDLDEPVYATPAIEQGRIYVRTAVGLYCFVRQ
jgi:outer membrane protein assembly factor BamB